MSYSMSVYRGHQDWDPASCSGIYLESKSRMIGKSELT